jgi:hypothetical protein
MQPLAVAAIALGTGIMIGVAGGSMLPRKSISSAKTEPAVLPDTDETDDAEALLAANANLVNTLQECNRRLAALGQKRVAEPIAQPATPAATSSGRARGQGRRETTSQDWERYAKQGVVPYNVPCLRETPFTPSERQLDRLGLAPQDASVLREAYRKSNERVMAQMKPLCARVLGNEQLADRVGSSACMSAIVDSARKDNPDKMRDALARVGEVNAGKRPAPDATQGLEPVEALMLAFTSESKAFEADLAAALGPADAHRVAASRTLCSERGIVRAKTEPQQD